MRTRVIVLTSCVCLEFAAFISRLYCITVYFSFVDFDKKPSLLRKNAFYGFVVYSR